MKKQIHLQDVGIHMKNRVIFEHFTLDIEEGKDVCLIGPSGVGKTSLLRAVQGNVSFDGEILKEGSARVLLANSTQSEQSISDYLHYDELNVEEQKIVNSYLNLKTLRYSISKLNESFQLKVLLLEQILKKPKFLFLDDLLADFSYSEKKALFDLLHQLSITLVYVTSNMEDSLFFSYLVVMGTHGILMEGATYLILREEKILNRLGFSLPFLVDLSLQLQRYGLVNQIYFDEKELTNVLWRSN